MGAETVSPGGTLSWGVRIKVGVLDERDMVVDVLDLFHLLHDLGVDNGEAVSANGRAQQNYPWLKGPAGNPALIRAKSSGLYSLGILQLTDLNANSCISLTL